MNFTFQSFKSIIFVVVMLTDLYFHVDNITFNYQKKVVTNSGMIIQLTDYWIIVIYDEIIFERDR